jgi:hypothetical protein
MNHTIEIYQWMHELIENARFQSVAYDADYLYCSDAIALYQIDRRCIIWKQWQKAHEECWHTSGYQWRKGNAREGELACGGFDVEKFKAPRLSSIYAIIGSAVQNGMIAGDRVFKSSHASKEWILEQDKFFGVRFNKGRLWDALNMPLFGNKCQFALLENGALRLTSSKHPKAFAYVMCMSGGEE